MKQHILEEGGYKACIFDILFSMVRVSYFTKYMETMGQKQYLKDMTIFVLAEFNVYILNRTEKLLKT